MKHGRNVVITGAAGGMGSVLVNRFLVNGDTVIATDIKDEALGKLQSELKSRDKLIVASADISKEADCMRLAGIAHENVRQVQVLINCAGYFPVRPFEEISAEDWRQVIDVNLTSTFYMIKAMLPLMKERAWGRIISFGSASVFEGVPGQAHYVAAKAGLVGLSRSLAREIGEYGITVNIVTPGLTVTPPVRKTFSPELLEKQKNLRSLKRDEVPEDLIGAVFFLASPDADFISGQIINVDGGKTMY
jgi:3-oxoacyl-[acyl-carrier protein] reductase